jgi:hypothetical protein
VYKSGYRLLHLYDEGEDSGDDLADPAPAQIAA